MSQETITRLWIFLGKRDKEAVGIDLMKRGKKSIYKITCVFYLPIGPTSPKTLWQNIHNILYNGNKQQ